MENSILNSFVFMISVFFVFGMVVTITVVDAIYEPIIDELTSLGMYDSTKPYFEIYELMKGYVLGGFKLMLWFLIAWGLFSSFVSEGGFFQYIGLGLANIILTAFIIYITGTVWNSFILSSAEILDYNQAMSSGLLIVVENFSLLLGANLIAGFMSFVFKRIRDGRNEFSEITA